MQRASNLENDSMAAHEVWTWASTGSEGKEGANITQKGSVALPVEACEGNDGLFDYCEGDLQFEDTFVEFPSRDACVEAGNDRLSDDSDREAENGVKEGNREEDGFDGDHENDARLPENLGEAEVLKSL